MEGDAKEMTVADLKALLSDLPDAMAVGIWRHYFLPLVNTAIERSQKFDDRGERVENRNVLILRFAQE